MTQTKAQLIKVAYRKDWGVVPPARAVLLDDGRIVATTEDGDHEYFGGEEFGERYPYRHRMDFADEIVPFEAEPIIVDHSVQLDWAQVHHLMKEIDRARRGTRIGHSGTADAFGGTYHTSAYSHCLASAVRLVAAVGRIARDAHAVVRDAGRAFGEAERHVEGARSACKVAVACAKAFAMFHEAGLIEDPSNRICGTVEGYGLTGLRLLAGEDDDGFVSSEDVEIFAAGGPLLGNARLALRDPTADEGRVSYDVTEHEFRCHLVHGVKGTMQDRHEVAAEFEPARDQVGAPKEEFRRVVDLLFARWPSVDVIRTNFGWAYLRYGRELAAEAERKRIARSA